VFNREDLALIDPVIGVSVIAFLTGISQLYLGVHYPTDVVAGWAIATSWLALGIFAAELSKFFKGQNISGRFKEKSTE
jgi:membrane-associated phospholipid phosphatase